MTRIRLAYRPDRLDPARAARIAGYHRAALRHAGAEPDAPHHQAQLLSEQELAQQLSGIGYRHRELPDRCAHELFEEQRPRSTPTPWPPCSARTRWTYGELNAARQPDRPRACSPRDCARRTSSPSSPSGTWTGWPRCSAVFKAGGVYLPIEPHFPAERIARC